jgi:tetratricopeptide (TPR) repeat protein
MDAKRVVWLALGLVVLLVLAYANTFSVPFIFDDEPSIAENTTITHPAGIGEAFAPPRNTTLEGRPVANATLAANYAISGMRVWSYHVVNLTIHAGAALLLFGIVRRTLLRKETWAEEADFVAWITAGLWALHPLQTESVTYIVQRVESLMGFSYLLTLYAFIRACETGGAKTWGWLAVAACWLGMGTKEVMVSAPLIVLLYDRTVVAGTFVDAWWRRKWVYAGLFASWALLGWLLASSFDRANTAGFNAGISSWHYLLTQCHAITTYVWLSVWPAELTFDYGRLLVKNPAEVWLQGLVLVMLFAGSVVAMIRKSWAGVAGIWFFATLAPSSSVVPVATQTMTEHRVYLALAAVALVVTAVVWRYAGRLGLLVLAMAVPVLALATHRRNELYREPLKLWTDTTVKLPGSARAQGAVGYILSMDGRPAEALPFFERAVAEGDYVDAELYANYAYALNASGQVAEAERALKKALTLNPRHHKVLAQQGNIAMRRGQMREAADFFEQALKYAPGYQTARTNLAATYLNLGDVEKAAREYGEVLKRDENCSRAWSGLAVIAFQAGRLDESEALCRRALVVAVKADEAEARSRLGEVLAAQQRMNEAEAEFARSLELIPRSAETRQNFAAVLARQGRYAQAIAQYERLRGETEPSADLLGNLGLALELSGQHERAKSCYEQALAINPSHPFAGERLSGLSSRENR